MRKERVFKKNYQGGWAGFSLVEIAIVMVIIGLLTVGGLNVVKLKREQALYASSDSALEQVKEAMLAFVVINGHMPCPDTNNDGDEDRGSRECSAITGQVPYVTLGLTVKNVKDGWGNFIQYSTNTSVNVLPSVIDGNNSASYFDYDSEPTALTFDLETPPTVLYPASNNLDIDDGAGVTSASNQSIVLVAYNSNGIATFSNCATLIVNERENCDGDANFVQADLVTGNSGNFFDDKLISISPNEIRSAILKNNPSSI